MEWYAFTHGWKGLVHVLAATMGPMWLGLAHGPTSARHWLLSPAYAFGLAFAALGFLSILFPVLRTAIDLCESSQAATLVGFGTCIAAGYLSGLRLTRPRLADTYVDGTKVVDRRRKD